MYKIVDDPSKDEQEEIDNLVKVMSSMSMIYSRIVKNHQSETKYYIMMRIKKSLITQVVREAYR